MNFAREAFCTGYAVYGAVPLLPRSRTACEASERLLGEIYSPSTLRFIEATGATEGLYAQIYHRRDRLWMKYDGRVRRWAKKLSLMIDPEDFGTEIRKALQGAPDTTEGERKAVKQIAHEYISALLSKYPKLAKEITEIATEFEDEAKAEGQVAAQALLGHSRGKKVADLGPQVRKALAALAKNKDHGKNAGRDSGVLIAGLAGDVAVSAAAEKNQGSSDDETGENAQSVIAAGAGAAFYADSTIHAIWSTAMLAIYVLTNPVAYVNFVTVGDDRVCPQCLAAEDGNPYLPSDVPPIPYHGSCRCWYTPAD